MKECFLSCYFNDEQRRPEETMQRDLHLMAHHFHRRVVKIPGHWNGSSSFSRSMVVGSLQSQSCVGRAKSNIPSLLSLEEKVASIAGQSMTMGATTVVMGWKDTACIASLVFALATSSQCPVGGVWACEGQVNARMGHSTPWAVTDLQR